MADPAQRVLNSLLNALLKLRARQLAPAEVTFDDISRGSSELL